MKEKYLILKEWHDIIKAGFWPVQFNPNLNLQEKERIYKVINFKLMDYDKLGNLLNDI